MLLCLVPSRLHLFREPSPSLFPCLDIGQVLALLSLPRVGFKACICLSRPTVNRTRPATTLVPSTHTRRFLLCVAPASLAHVKAVLMAKLTRRAGAVCRIVTLSVVRVLLSGSVKRPHQARTLSCRAPDRRRAWPRAIGSHELFQGLDGANCVVQPGPEHSSLAQADAVPRLTSAVHRLARHQCPAPVEVSPCTAAFGRRLLLCWRGLLL